MAQERAPAAYSRDSRLRMSEMELDPDDLRDPVGRVFEQLASLIAIFLIAVGIDLAVQVAAHAVEWATYENQDGLAR